jgi:hypothetical protein
LLYISEGDITRFIAYRDKAIAIFRENLEKTPCLFHRALLALIFSNPIDGWDDYYEERGSRAYYYEDKKNIRFYMLQYHDWGNFYYELLKLLFDTVPSSHGAYDYLQKIIDTIPFDEKKVQTYFITSPHCFDYCTQKLVSIKGEQIYLLQHSRMSHTHAELRTYYLYNEWMQYKKKFAPFTTYDYYSPTNSSEEPCAYLDRFQYTGYIFAMDIYYIDSAYELQFFSRDDEDGSSKFKKILNDINTQAGLEMELKKTERYNLTATCANMQAVEKRILEICNLLGKGCK